MCYVILHEYPKLDLAPGAAGPLHLHSLGVHLLDETSCQGRRLSHSLTKVVTDQQVGRFASTMSQAFLPIFPALRSAVGILLKAMLPYCRGDCPGHQVGIVASAVTNQVTKPSATVKPNPKGTTTISQLLSSFYIKLTG